MHAGQDMGKQGRMLLATWAINLKQARTDRSNIPAYMHQGLKATRLKRAKRGWSAHRLTTGSIMDQVKVLDMGGTIKSVGLVNRRLGLVSCAEKTTTWRGHALTRARSRS